MIDGGPMPGAEYQLCCITQPLKGASLAARLLPGGRAVWNYDALHDYADRWATVGVWSAPDNWDATNPRVPRNFTDLHGTEKNKGFYSSSFVNQMWKAYRAQAE